MVYFSYPASVARQFRPVAPAAYAQEPHVPGQPRHGELGQVRRAVPQLSCDPFEATRLSCYLQGNLFCYTYKRALSTPEIRVFTRRGQKTGFLSRNLDFRDVWCASSRLNFVADDARQSHSAPNMTLPASCQHVNT